MEVFGNWVTTGVGDEADKALDKVLQVPEKKRRLTGSRTGGDKWQDPG